MIILLIIYIDYNKNNILHYQAINEFLSSSGVNPGFSPLVLRYNFIK
jgi:hypothetical protein